VSPKTDQKCRMGSYIIRRLSFAVVPQDEGYPINISPFFGRNLPHASLSKYEYIIHTVGFIFNLFEVLHVMHMYDMPYIAII
jgi:hypothetical protein